MQATWTHHNFAATRAPVSSKCATGAARNCPWVAVVNPSSRAATVGNSEASQPVEAGTPKQSAISSAARATGRCCLTSR